MVNDYNYSEDCRRFEKKHGKVEFVMTRKQYLDHIPKWFRSEKSFFPFNLRKIKKHIRQERCK